MRSPWDSILLNLQLSTSALRPESGVCKAYLGFGLALLQISFGFESLSDATLDTISRVSRKKVPFELVYLYLDWNGTATCLVWISWLMETAL